MRTARRELATEKTDVRILCTRHAVYFGVHCYDSPPARIVATEPRRDASQDLDDHFGILIEHRNDSFSRRVIELFGLFTGDSQV